MSTSMHSNANANGEPSFTHAVSRSSELLSCAKTALKIGKAQHANDNDYDGTTWWACQEPNLLALCSWKNDQSNSHLDGLCEDGLSLLRAMDAELQQLETLVRRRGHTNDPTEEIAASVRRLETDAKELSSIVKTGFVFPRSTAQYQRHTGLIASWLESVAALHMAKLKEILKVRGNVLADQAQRRKMLNPQGPGATNNSNGTNNGQSHMNAATMTPMAMKEPKKPAHKAMDTPLFTMTPLPRPNQYSNSNGAYQNGGAATTTGKLTNNNYAGSNGFQTPSSTMATPAYGATTTGGYGAATTTGGYGGYGGAGQGAYGGGGLAATTGMRKRGHKGTAGSYYQNNNATEEQEEAEKVRSQIQVRQQQRQTQSRLEEAHQAERTLAELGTMFSKMTNLISQQGEVLEKVEDDMEAGLTSIMGGQDEITKLYGIKKGNRGLIIKVFSLLIFLIIFMKFYKK